MLTLEDFHVWLIGLFPKAEYRLYFNGSVVYTPSHLQTFSFWPEKKVRRPEKKSTDLDYTLYFRKDMFQKNVIEYSLEASTLEGLRTWIQQECLTTPEEQQRELGNIIGSIAQRLSQHQEN